MQMTNKENRSHVRKKTRRESAGLTSDERMASVSLSNGVSSLRVMAEGGYTRVPYNAA
jgi:hypothetical protein